jgi:hypothetical protein
MGSGGVAGRIHHQDASRRPPPVQPDDHFLRRLGGGSAPLKEIEGRAGSPDFDDRLAPVFDSA